MGLKDVVAKRRAEKPKSLAELRARKQAERERNGQANGLTGLAAVKARKEADKTRKQDFHRAGLRYHNARRVNNSYWAVDVSNGDKTYTLHNRHGAWFHDVSGDGRMVEPVAVAMALGTDVTQIQISRALMDRVEAEMHARGILTPEQQLRQREEEEKANRRKRRSKQD